MIFRLLLPLLLLVSVGEVAAEAATIVFATGDARIVAADGVSRPAARGAAVEAGETVDTGDGKAQMKFRDGASIALQAGTQFRVEQFRFSGQDGRAAAEDAVVMRFLKGALRAVSGLIGKEKREQYRMDTAVGTIGIRGTEYGATMGDGGLSVTTYAGLVEVCNSAGCAQAGPGQTLNVMGSNVRPGLRAGGTPALTPGAALPQLPAPQQTAPVLQQQPATPPPANTMTHGPYY
ncbi:MAG: FecR domain-containing protein [Rhodocyclaceae bacterium]